ncbi:unnamed protein product [Paramecium pentaurelia]|uniref:peptide-methionine (R)-S-oxide reductase n=1 Tax=Paramecium pentaurelia TaxID=43138 RepID=A0A8S1SU55_9CILI|nr:unnamed protein product [Paramecium pentaurelia]
MKIKFQYSKIIEAINRNLIKPKQKIEIRLDRLSMDPHRYWISVAKGMERPFTGEFWNHDQQGVYQCFHCQNTLFQSDYKYQSQTGYASFFKHHKNSVKTIETKEKYDGPPPTFLRYSINSSALRFYQPKKNQTNLNQSQK